MLRNKKIFYSFLSYIIAAIFIYNCNSMWTSMSSLRRLVNLSYAVLICTSLVYILVLFKSQAREKIKKLAEITITVLLYLLIYCLFTTTPIKVLRLSIIIILFIWMIGLDNQTIPFILIKYKNIIILVAMISLFFWLLGPILHLIAPDGYVLSNWSAFNGIALYVPSYHNLYFEAQTLSTSITNLPRNTAIFTEAPMASLNFSLALLIETLYPPVSDKSSKIKKIILILALITTFSTTGYLFLILLFCIKFFTSQKSNINKRYVIILIPIILFIGIVIVMLLLNEKLNFDSGSSGIRLDDYKVGLIAWMSHPLFGIGIQNTHELIRFMGNWRTFNTGFSNSLMDLLSGGGIYITSSYVFCFFRGISTSTKTKDWNKFWFILLTIYLFILTIFTYSYILLFLLIWFAFSTQKYA